MDDLSEFHDVFFEEAAEHLAAMESLLVDIDVNAADAEQLNAIFRAAHSIKGGAATFGFEDIAALTHEMETVFDRVRKGTMALSTDLVNAFLASGDLLKSMFAARKGDGTGPLQKDVADLCTRLRAFLDTAAAPAASAPVQTPAAPAAPVPEQRELEITFGPFDDTFTAASVDAVVARLTVFGTVDEMALSGPAGHREGKKGKSKAPAERRFRLVTPATQAEVGDALGFVVDPERIRIAEPQTTPPTVAQAPAAAAVEAADFGLFVDPATLPAAQAKQPDPVPIEAKPEAKPEAKGEVKGEVKPEAKAAAAHGSGDTASIRVSVQKVDQLVNLVGELVITQAMLAQTASKSDPVLYESLFNGLAQLQRNTRDLQEATMSIRMMPISFAFSRFPRVVRDVAAKLGKEVELHTVGEGTELDKGLIERIVDPLTHLVRNSLDHGLEAPQERKAKGKPRKGSITLRAYHQGGSIVIEVGDDGRGLRREKILSKARERGMTVSDQMTDAEVWQLIFEAGFSTAEVVTDVSGRGVGMDVVRRNIQEMGGRVEIESAVDVGTRITIKVPLTLAILDGMSVRLGREIFILPLGYICESLQPKAGSVSTISGRGEVVSVRGEYVPVLRLDEVMGTRGGRDRFEDGILVILEAEGGKTALFVDDLVGQHQVVIKSLETNYRKVPGISGATIMGDGRVAMILDVAHVVGLAHSRIEKAA